MSQITTHILDTALGCPAVGVHISLHCLNGDSRRTLIGAGETNSDGRVPELCAQKMVLAAGSYCVHFATAAYFEGLGGEAFYPHVDVVFTIAGDGRHYHIPLLLSPYGYSTYRGS